MLCFISPRDAIRVIANVVGCEARRQLLNEVVWAWIDEIPEDKLGLRYAKAIAELPEDDVRMLSAWHASVEVPLLGVSKEFLLEAFTSLGEHRRAALKLAVQLHGEKAFDEGVTEEQTLELVLSFLSDARCKELAQECVELYCWDRLGTEN